MGKIEVRETGDLLESLASGSSVLRGATPWQRLKAAWARMLSILMPTLPISGYCPSCWSQMELVDDQPLSGSDAAMINGVRFWRCPKCRSGASTRYSYVRPPDYDWWLD
ncbi:MAG: hypothetical protein Q7K03_02720 [Dehalococcoidia bacterium]|nr:hypothetical protein [Dehalococcoidia bacterium]